MATGIGLSSLLGQRERMGLTVGAEEAVPALVADALEGDVAGAVLAAGQRNALVALVAVEAEVAAALAGPPAVALHRVAALAADRHVAQVALPARQALQVAVIVAAVVRLLVLRGRNLARLTGKHAVSVGCRILSTRTLLTCFFHFGTYRAALASFTSFAKIIATTKIANTFSSTWAILRGTQCFCSFYCLSVGPRLLLGRRRKQNKLL